MPESSGQPLTVDTSTLTLALLAERVQGERALREQAERFLADDFSEFKVEMQRRLDELNHAHANAVEAQARTVPRELFDQFVKENDARREASFSALGNRLEAAIVASKDAFSVGLDGLEKEIAIERNARIRAEGSVAVWRFIAVFLGLPGIVALFLAAAAVFGPPAVTP